MTTETKAVVEPGVYDDVPHEVYASWEACNYSTLKLLGRTPAHALYDMEHPAEPTEAMELGSGTHAAILETEHFRRLFVRAPKFDRRTKVGKEGFADFQLANLDKTILPDEDYADAEGMCESCHAAGTLANEILSSPGTNERSFVWVDAETGLLCKGRCDGMRIWEGTLVLDIKTAKSADALAFGKEILNRYYHVQAAFYLDGLDAIAAAARRFAWIAVEKSPPYLTAVYDASPRMLAAGRRLYRQWLADFKACTASGEWPGYPNRIEEIDLPAWYKDD